ncbi:MAG: hypothetical protein HYU36_01295 [Planctomycetes bacterium]|nr:hypothetical protein [Planctomycetota bacterium]
MFIQKYYASNAEVRLILFGLKGVREREFKIADPALDETRQFLVHPAGGRLLLLSHQHLYWFEILDFLLRPQRGSSGP